MRKTLFLLFVLFSLSVSAANDGISFIKDSTLVDALSKAKQENKLLFIDCYTSWCGPCKYMEKNVFPLKEVGDFYNEHFVCWKMDMETPEGALIKNKYNVRGYPTYLFLNGDGELVHRGLGSCDFTMFISHLGKTALDSTKNYLGVKIKVRYGDRTAETLLKYVQANPYGSDNDSLINQHFALVADSDKLSANSWYLFKQHVNSTDAPIFKFFVDNKQKYESVYGEKEVADKMVDVLNTCYREDPNRYNALKSIDPVLFEKNKLMNDFYFTLDLWKYQLPKDDKKNWNILTVKMVEFLDREDVPAVWDLNNMSWFVYENYKKFKDVAILKKAAEWSKRSLLVEPENDQFLDTYAHIIFDLGQKKEAIKYEEKALKKAEEMKDKGQIEWYGGELKKFKGKK